MGPNVDQIINPWNTSCAEIAHNLPLALLVGGIAHGLRHAAPVVALDGRALLAQHHNLEALEVRELGTAELGGTALSPGGSLPLFG